MSNAELVFANAPLQERIQWAKAIAGAGNLVPAGFRDGNNANPAKILLAVEYGAMLGLHPMAALAGIHVIDGKPTLSAALMSAQVHKAGHKLRVTTSGTVDGGDYTVTATLVRADDPAHPFTDVWTIGRAQRADLWGKGNWKKYPETQMQWRAISGVTKLGAPEVLLGVWYTPDELGATVDADGDVIEDAEIVEDVASGQLVTPGGNVGVSGHANEARVSAELAKEHTPSTVGTPRRGRSRPHEAAGPATTDQWAARITDTMSLRALFVLHNEAATAGVLDKRDAHGNTIEDLFVARRTELQAPKVQAPAPAADAYDPDEVF